MNRGISIHIGVNYVDREHYGNDVIPLDTCEQDAKEMQSIALSQNFKSSFLLLSENATRDAVKSAIESASRELKEGDILLVSYSGHGGFIADISGDEEDGLDETWCLYDAQLLDDELNQLWTLFNEGVRIFILSDSCHSGTVAKARNEPEVDTKLFKKKLLSYEVGKNIYFANKDFYRNLEIEVGDVDEKEIKASIKLFAACQDPQVSYTLMLAENSIFTAKVKEVWNKGQFVGTYEEFFEMVKEKVSSLDFLPTVQTPNLYNIGKANPKFDNMKPFGIYMT